MTTTPWHHIHDACKVCGGTDRKHYSGGNCTRCYTIARNARLGIGSDPTKKKERLEKKLLKLEIEMIQAQEELDTLNANLEEQEIAS